MSAKEKIDSPKYLNIEDVESCRELITNGYFETYFYYGSPPSVILVPKKAECLLHCKWRMYCQIPAKWEPKIILEEHVEELVFITPQKDVFVCPTVLKKEENNLSLGFILGSFKEK